MSNSLEQKWYERDWARLLLAIGLNVAFAVGVKLCFSPHYELNDDLSIQQFMDGQMEHKTAYIMFCNYYLARILIWLYDLTGNAVPIYSLFQYALMAVSFTGACYVILKRLPIIQALTVSVCVLCLIGIDGAVNLTYTKTVGLCTVSAFLIMFQAMHERSAEKLLMLVFGGAIAVAAMLLRDKQFAACTVLMAPIGLYELTGYVKGSEKKLMAGVKYAAPFAVVLAICAGLYLGNEFEWNNSIYRENRQFVKAVSELVDLHGGVPDYELMPEVYDSLGIDENMVSMARYYEGFDDTEKWTTEACEKIIEARAQLQGETGLLTLLGKYLECIPAFFMLENVIAYPYCFLIMLFIWVVIGRKDKRSILTVLAELILFSALYLILISENRYMTKRTDSGFFMAMSVTLLWLLENKRGWLKKGICLVLVAVGAFLGLYLNRSRCTLYPYNSISDSGSLMMQMETLTEDGHLFLTGGAALNVIDCPTMEMLPAGYRDSVVFMGGWEAQNPEVEAVFARYGVVNPYRDIVDNRQVYVINDSIDRLVEYINDNYMGENECIAEPEEALSGRTGIDIYRIVTK